MADLVIIQWRDPRSGELKAGDPVARELAEAWEKRTQVEMPNLSYSISAVGADGKPVPQESAEVGV